MKRLMVNLSKNAYSVIICNDFQTIVQEIKSEVGGTAKIVVITDTTVSGLYLNSLMKQLLTCYSIVLSYCICPGEQSKNLDNAVRLYQYLLQNEISKTDCILALGGGVVGDLAGFVASTYKRGIPYIQVPTTLLSQVDSSIGGKVGFNFQGIKNAIGSIYQPKLVYINTDTLASLSTRQINNGIAEIIVHACIADKQLLEFVLTSKSLIYSNDPGVMEKLITWNCKIKAQVVAEDEKDENVREKLNFGHTFGHAIESIELSHMLHGECVAIGIIAAFIIAQEKGMVCDADVNKIRKAIEDIGLPTRVYDPELTVEHLVEKIKQDKKVRNNRLRLILPTCIGAVVPVNSDLSQINFGCLDHLFAG